MSRNLLVFCKFSNQLSGALLMSPDERYMFHGHHSVEGQEESSELVQSPQWQFLWSGSKCRK
jgi:hypothetical protein